MSKRMTIVFHDETLYTTLKVEAARRHTSASELVAAALREWLERDESIEEPGSHEKVDRVAEASTGQAQDRDGGVRIEPGTALLDAVEAMEAPDIATSEERSVARDHDRHLYTRSGEPT